MQARLPFLKRRMIELKNRWVMTTESGRFHVQLMVDVSHSTGLDFSFLTIYLN